MDENWSVRQYDSTTVPRAKNEEEVPVKKESTTYDTMIATSFLYLFFIFFSPWHGAAYTIVLVDGGSSVLAACGLSSMVF